MHRNFLTGDMPLLGFAWCTLESTVLSHARAHTRSHSHTHTHTRAHTHHTHTQTHSLTHSHTSHIAHIHTHTNTHHKHVYTHTNTHHKHIHTHIHIHTHLACLRPYRDEPSRTSPDAHGSLLQGSNSGLAMGLQYTVLRSVCWNVWFIWTIVSTTQVHYLQLQPRQHCLLRDVVHTKKCVLEVC